MPARRVDLPGAAALAGVSEKTYAKYLKEGKANGTGPDLPPVGDDGKQDEAEVLAWVAARPGGGKPRGAKPRMTPCVRCKTPVARRWKDEKSGDLLCKPCLVQADQAG